MESVIEEMELLLSRGGWFAKACVCGSLVGDMSEVPKVKK